MSSIVYLSLTTLPHSSNQLIARILFTPGVNLFQPVIFRHPGQGSNVELYVDGGVVSLSQNLPLEGNIMTAMQLEDATLEAGQMICYCFPFGPSRVSRGAMVTMKISDSLLLLYTSQQFPKLKEQGKISLRRKGAAIACTTGIPVHTMGLLSGEEEMGDRTIGLESFRSQEWLIS
eukprot:scaffold900_cov72-Cylindrotheca_fusiformis.AAC.1